MRLDKMQFTLILIGVFLIGSVAGGVIVETANQNSKADVTTSSTTSTTTTDLNSNTLVDQVLGGLSDSIALGVAKANADANPTTTSMIPQADSFTDKVVSAVHSAGLYAARLPNKLHFVDTAHAQTGSQCINLATSAINSAVSQWLPTAIGPCGEIDSAYNATYTVSNSIVTSGRSKTYFSDIKVTLTAKTVTQLWKDNNCTTRSLALNLAPITRYYVNDSGASVRPISASQYNSDTTPGTNHTVTLWCSGTINDSSTTDLNPPVAVKAGDTVATAVGFKGTNNVTVDFGVYDLRQKNAISADATWASQHASDTEFAPYGVCWLDLLSATDSAKAKSLPGADQISGKTSDYCK